MKEYYFCTIDEKKRRSAVDSGKYLSGLGKFSRCPARKNREVRIGKIKKLNIKNNLIKNLYNKDRKIRIHPSPSPKKERKGRTMKKNYF